MKRCAILIATVLLAGGFAMGQQKYGFVDTEYILNNIPSYKAAQNKLDDLSAQWEEEISQGYQVLDKMYKKYQSESVLMSNEMKTREEEKIIKREKEINQLQQKYFGPEGELFQKRQELIQPIQDQIYEAVKELALEGNYAVIFDTSAGVNMLYTNPKYDVSDEILEKLGYKN